MGFGHLKYILSHKHIINIIIQFVDAFDWSDMITTFMDCTKLEKEHKLSNNKTWIKCMKEDEHVGQLKLQFTPLYPKFSTA